MTVEKKKDSNAITRQQAIADGLQTYNGGRQCQICNGHERYTSNSSCVSCRTNPEPRVSLDQGMRKMNADAWREAQARGDMQYHRATPCIKCWREGDMSSTLRYTSNGGCVACQVRAATKRYEDRRARANRPAVAPIVFGAAACRHVEHINALFPEQPGKTLVYGKHHLFANLTGTYNSLHLGRCIFCYPDRAVMMWNIMDSMHTVPEEYHATWVLLKFVTARTPEYPHGYLEHCNRERVKAGRTTATVAEPLQRLGFLHGLRLPSDDEY